VAAPFEADVANRDLILHAIAFAYADHDYRDAYGDLIEQALG